MSHAPTRTRTITWIAAVAFILPLFAVTQNTFAQRRDRRSHAPRIERVDTTMHHRTHRNRGGRQRIAVCEAPPSPAQIRFERGRIAGFEAGRSDGAHDGRHGHVSCGTPPAADLKRRSPAYRQGYRSAYAVAYQRAYARASAERRHVNHRRWRRPAAPRWSFRFDF